MAPAPKKPGRRIPLGFKSIGSVKETHREQIYCVSWSDDFYQDTTAGDDTKLQCFATCGGNVISVYEVHETSRPYIRLRQGYVDAQEKECFYACAWGGRSLGRPFGYGPIEQLEKTTDANEPIVIDATSSSSTTRKRPREDEEEGKEEKETKDETEKQESSSSSTKDDTTTTSPPNNDPDQLYQALVDTDTFDGPQLLCVAGTGAVIKVIDVCRRMLYTTLSSHGSDIYDLKFSPIDEWILLSASKDESLRMWNVKTSTCIALFSGHEGHRDCVLSVAWHLNGHSFVSGGMDTTVKVWHVGPGTDVYKAIEKSHVVKPKRWDQRVDDPSSKHPVLYEQMPIFSTDKVHTSYVDAIQFVGDLILSKDTNETVVLWKPIIEKKHRGSNTKTEQRLPNEIIALREFVMNKCDVWFIRFNTDPQCRMLAMGNMIGEIKVWEIGARPTKKHFCNLIHQYCTAAVRMVTFNHDAKYMVAVSDDACVWLWEAVTKR